MGRKAPERWKGHREAGGRKGSQGRKRGNAASFRQRLPKGISLKALANGKNGADKEPRSIPPVFPID